MTRKLLGFILFGSLALFLFLNIPSPIRIQGDGVFYYAWVRSAVFDFDMDFRNELEYFSEYDFYSKKFVVENITTEAGRIPNPYAFGTAALWTPFVLVASVLSFAGDILMGGGFFVPDGFSFFFVFLVNFASWLFGAVSFLTIFATLKRNFSEKESLVSTTLLFLGTPWVYYQFFEPSMSHMASLLCVSLFFYQAVKFLEGERITGTVFFLTIFFAISVRWQNLLSVAVFLLTAFFSKRERHSVGKVFVSASFAFFGVLLIQCSLWKIIYDQWFLIPQGSGFLFSGFHGMATLLSSNRGLFFWSPVFLLSFLGLFSRRGDRRIIPVVVGSFLSQWIINSSLSDIAGGDAFGARRFIEVIPFLAFPLALTLKYSRKRLIFFLATIFVIWNLILLVLYHFDRIPRSGGVDIMRILPLSEKNRLPE